MTYYKSVIRFNLFLIFAFLIGGIDVSAQTTDKPADRLSASFAQVARKVESAVVNIDTKGRIPVGSRNDDDDRRPTGSVGSGFIVDKTGYILTNHHVVEDSSRITVRLKSNEEFAARIIGMDEETDMAVLKIEAGRDLPFLLLGNSDRAEIGDWVLAIGSPFGLEQTVTAGIVSQTRRETPYSAFQKFIQTDAAINRGNSGGPLVNMDGEVIGVNSMIASTTGDYNGIGFALPSNEASYVYKQILQNERVRRGYLGVILDSVKREFAKVYGLTEPKGAIVTDVRDRAGAAAIAGIQTGDIIIEFNGLQVLNAQDLIEKVASTTPDKEVNVTYLRENGTRLDRKTVLVKLSERPSNNVATDDEPKKLPLEGTTQKTLQPFGLTLGEIPPQVATLFKIEGQPGIVIRAINQSSYIADLRNSNGTEAAITEGDVIQRINRTPVTDLRTFNEIAAKLKKGDAVVLHILNFDRRTRTVSQRIVQFTVQ
ncbi:MAG TPA: trypsin-like peptidase domain-containing protein [Pyrinomonadaceae bacterium]|nr:trypsin-like peptidase domain-containing protein [Pyrinomonadaceae bacterium]